MMSLREISYRQHPHLYELNTWSWLTELSERAGHKLFLSDVPEQEWDQFRAKGFDFIWLMGIWERSPAARRIAQTDASLEAEYTRALPNWRPQDIVGSAYAIYSYRPDPQLGTWDDLALTRQKLNERGIGLILDFVPNHTAVDHEWITSCPELYVNADCEPESAASNAFFPIQTQASKSRYIAHGKDPYFPAWRDTAQLNHFNPATRKALLEQLQIIATYCDGVRCDMAMLVLNDVFEKTWAGLLAHPRPETEFWRDAIAAIPDLVWLAEVYWNKERDLQEIGFAFTYDKRLYDGLRGGLVDAVKSQLKAEMAYQKKLVRFLENHDERRSASVFDAGRFPAVGVLSATLPGMRFYHQGQLEGKRIRLPVQLCRAASEQPDPYFADFYAKILRWTNDEVFHTDVWTLLRIDSAGDGSHENLIAYQWRTSRSWKLLAVNLSSSIARGFVRLEQVPGRPIGGGESLWLLDQLTGSTYRRSREEVVQGGLYVELSSFDAHFFSVQDGSDRPNGVRRFGQTL